MKCQPAAAALAALLCLGCGPAWGAFTCYTPGATTQFCQGTQMNWAIAREDGNFVFSLGTAPANIFCTLPNHDLPGVAAGKAFVVPASHPRFNQIVSFVQAVLINDNSDGSIMATGVLL